MKGDTDQPIFSTENFALFWSDAAELIDKHYREIAHYADIPLDVDVMRYLNAEAAGQLRVYTARVDVGSDLPMVLVGYVLFFVAHNPHYQTSLQAVGDVVYLDPGWRKGTIGRDLLRYAEAELRGENVQALYHHVKCKHPALGVLLSRDGYEMIDVIYAKRLDTDGELGKATLREGETSGAGKSSLASPGV